MRHSFLVRLLLVTSAVTVFSVGAALAQFTPDISQGDYPGAIYLGSDYEHVDPATGRVYLHIPLLTDHSQRGDLNFSYNVSWSGTGTWVTTCYSGLHGSHICGYWPSAEGTSANTLAYIGPAPVMDGGVSTCPASCNRSATNPIGVSDGGVHIAYQLPSQSLQRTTDGSGILVSTSSPFAVTDKLGRVFTNPSLIPIVTGRNGNRMTMSVNGPGFASGEFAPQLNSGKPANSWTMTDTVGRSWSYAPAANTNGCPSNVGADRAEIWTTPGPSGSARAFEFCFSPVSISTNLPVSQGSGVTTQQYVSTTEFLSAIVLPDGTNWQFQYNDSYGDLTKLVLPTGGTITYQYTTTTDPYLQETSFGFFSYIRTVSSRTVFDGTNSNTWSYVAASYSYPNPFVYTVTDPLGNGTVYTGGTISSGSSTAKIQYYTGSASSGTLLKTVNKTYLQSPPGTTHCWLPALPLSTTTTWPNGQSSSVTLTYDSGFQFTCQGASSTQSTYGSVTSTTETDYSGITLRQTNTQYEWQVNPSYLTANLLSFPYQVGVTGSGGTASVSCFSGTVQSCTTYGYDGLANLTSVTPSLNTGTSPVTQYAYNSYGMRTSATDPRNNVTNYKYDSTGVCVNEIDYPTPSSGAAQVEHFTCDTNTEQITDAADRNGQHTQYHYDVMLRPTEVDYPDVGQTTISYPSPTEIQTSEKIDSSHYKTSTIIFDGLGRTKQTQLNSDPDGTVYTDRTYDADGRVHTVSNPYRSTSDPTYGITTNLYDPLNRACLVAPPDAAPPSGSTCPATQPADTIFTVYSGNSTTVTDEQGKTRESLTDGLGRLTQVIEDPGASPHLNYTTNYTYDPLDNLTSVVQNGSHNRSLVYDSLSRLTSATNPESGATSYTYDASGNVLTRLDARTITTNYSYDALNRLTQKSYSDGTPITYFSYDQTTQNGITLSNPVGRLTWEGTNSGGWLTESVFSYDPVGRVINNSQCTPPTCPSASMFPLTYTYDLIGDMTSYTTGAAWLVFTQSFNAGGRVTQLTSSWSDSQHPATLASGIHYIASGAVAQMTYGNGLTGTNVYNSRLQPCLLDANNSGALLHTCTDSTPSGNVLDLWMGYNAGSTDSGNVMNWNATGAQSFVRTYGYDALNRLSTMSAPGDQCTGLSWTYDAWGNRTDQTATGGTCNTFHQSVDGNNRITGSPYQYDAGGNMIHDASHSYTYDAENRLTKVDGGGTATYTYDAEGRRISKVVGGVETDYIYDLSGHAVETYGGGCGNTCLNTAFMYLNGQLLAEYNSGTTYFAHTDHLGSTRLLTGYPTASVVECDDYYPFGESTNCGGTSTTTHKFTGYERDSETALDNAQARYNSSAMGRFMSPDPDNASGFENQDDPQSWNAYSYVRNNPLTLTDPDGRDYAACLYTDNGQSCVTYSNESDLQNALQGTGATLSGTEENGQIVINVNGQNQVVGTYQNFVGPGTEGGGLSDDPIIFPLFEGAAIGGLVSAARGFLEGLLGNAGREVATGAATGAGSGATGGLTPGTVFNAGKGLLQGEAELSSHAAAQAAARGVTNEEIADALSHVPKQEAGRGSVLRFIGQAAEVRVNKVTGTIVTVIRFASPGAASPLP